MLATQQVTLESLLFGAPSNQTGYVAMDLVDATLECADVLAEISLIEQNITTYEAAKMVKKAKSAAKKAKVKKTKMTAKDAKAKKAGGKVVKITKAKKVVREGDTDIDGGTGPLPTSADTNGLTDTDLDAAPDAEVEVTEIIEDGTPAEEIVGTEGADFIVMYEDADIVRFEAEEVAQKAALGDKIKELIQKIGNWIASFIQKIIDIFTNDKKFFDKNKAAIEKGLSADAKITLLPVATPAATAGKLLGDLEGVIGKFATAPAGETTVDFAVVNGVNLFTDGSKGKLEASVFGAEKAEAKEVDLKSSGWKMADIDFFVNKGSAELKKVQGAWKTFSSKQKITPESGVSTKAAVSGAYKCIGSVFGLYSRISSQASKVMRAASKAGGGEAAPAEGGDQK